MDSASFSLSAVEDGRCHLSLSKHLGEKNLLPTLLFNFPVVLLSYSQMYKYIFLLVVLGFVSLCVGAGKTAGHDHLVIPPPTLLLFLSLHVPYIIKIETKKQIGFSWLDMGIE
jgi:hypothetical protein